MFVLAAIFRKFLSNSLEISPVMIWALLILAYGNPALGGHSRSTLLLIALKPSGRSETRLFSLSEIDALAGQSFRKGAGE